MFGWSILASDANSGDVLYGKRHISTHVLADEDIGWFEAAVQDVRNTLGPGLTVLVNVHQGLPEARTRPRGRTARACQGRSGRPLRGLAPPPTRHGELRIDGDAVHLHRGHCDAADCLRRGTHRSGRSVNFPSGGRNYLEQEYLKRLVTQGTGQARHTRDWAPISLSP